MKRSKKLAILAALTMGVQFGSHASASDTDYDVGVKSPYS